jgi:hypothetical protein
VRRLLLALLLALISLSARRADGQIIRGGRFNVRDPQFWVSGGAGWQQGWTVIDGTTGTRWDLSDATAYGASIERTIAGGTTVSLRGSTAKVPISYAHTVLFDINGPAQADATVSQAFLGIHVASGRGLHSVLELGAGTTIYSNFRERGTGSALPPDKADLDFSFVFGYGIGYTFSRAFQIDVVQDLATSLHQKTGLSAGDNSSARISGTRLVARYGLGG